jgi:serine-type D-Ala-D-Ala carboxypeptidase/endopeptidase (penicillin-binding protein 4)
MNNPRARLARLLSLACALALAPHAPATAQQQRDRRVADSAPPSRPTTTRPTTQPTTQPPQPSPSSAPATVPTTPAVAAPRQQPASPASPALATRAGARTVEVLRSRISELLASPHLAPAHLAVRVASLDTGAVIFEENAGRLMMPASNMKLYTVAAALDRLGPDFRFVTSVYAPERPDSRGRVRGDLVIYGRGDPTFATRFAGDADYFKAVDELAARVASAGVRRVEGGIVGDESYFDGPPFGWGWEWDDLQWYYGAAVSALTVNDNSVDVFVRPGAREGAPAVVRIGPSFVGFPAVFGGGLADEQAAARSGSPLAVINRATTTARGTRREISLSRPLGQNYLEVGGTVPLGDEGGEPLSVTVPRPALLFASMLRASLERRGVRVEGRTQALDARERELLKTPFDPSRLVELARRESPPLAEIARHTMKPSQNLYTELLLRTLGKHATAQPVQSGTTQTTQPAAGQPSQPAPVQATSPAQSQPTRPAPGQTTAPAASSQSASAQSSQTAQTAQTAQSPRRQTAAQAGLAVVRQFLREAGVSQVERLSLVDGSGLARQNLITAQATVELLTYMSRHRHAQVFLDSQPVAGVDGTLRGRLRGTAAAGNLRAKTGTISNVSALSGYVTTAAGERLVFSVIVNHYTDAEGVPPRTNFIDAIAALLASFEGRSQ